MKTWGPRDSSSRYRWAPSCGSNLPSEVTVRESARARRVILRVFPEEGLVVVVPKGFNRGELPAILVKHGQWIRDVLGRLETSRGSTSDDVGRLPETIRLEAVGVCHRVVYKPGGEGSVRLSRTSPFELVCEGDLANPDLCIGILLKWLRIQGQLHLMPWLARTADELGLGYARGQVRNQRSRWGSCSARGTISLNQALLFLPPELVRYIMVHELCHTRHMDHSPKFWALVESFEPGHRSLDARMKDARSLVPFWARRH